MNTRESKPRRLIRSGSFRNKILLRTNLILLLALLMIIFVVPLIPLNDHYLIRVLFVILVASGLFAADFSRAAFRILFTVGSLVIMVTLLNIVFPDSHNLSLIMFALNTMFFIIVTIALVTHVAGAKEVYHSTLLCAINSYLMIGLTLSILFVIMDFNIPSSFVEVDSSVGSYSKFIYYGFVTLTTLGYGDITPDTAMARSLSTFTALFGQLYLVTIMALLIGKYLTGKKTTE